MSNSIDNYIRFKIQQRIKENNLRSLKTTKGLVDFYSNDYLGFSRDVELQQKIKEEIAAYHHPLYGSTGSRLLSGNSKYAEALEEFLAQNYKAESALLFNSGFDANYGLLSTLPYTGDTILYDEMVHASIHDGIRNSKANSFAFQHNNIIKLEEKLKAATGLKYVVVESIYSMDGDFAPLKEIVNVCEKYQAGLIVDEAHATGVFGLGRVANEIPDSKILARIHTFSKALGAHGAVIICSYELKQFLINYCRPFIYSTALPFQSLAAIKCAYEFLNQSQAKRESLHSIIKLFKEKVASRKIFHLITSNSPVQSLLVVGNQNVKEFASKIQDAGFDVRPILYPTVPKGKERVRICLHSFNTREEVINLAETLNSL